jgi:hypothetical protein
MGIDRSLYNFSSGEDRSSAINRENDRSIGASSKSDGINDSAEDFGYDIIETTHDLSAYLGFASQHKSRYVWFETVPTSNSKTSMASGDVMTNGSSPCTELDGEYRENQGSRQYLDFLLGAKANISTKAFDDIYDKEMHELRSVASDFIELKSEYFGPCVTNGFPIVYIRTDLVPSSDDNGAIRISSKVLASKNDIVTRLCDTGWSIPTPTMCSAIAAHPGTTTALPAGLAVLGLADGGLRVATVPSYTTCASPAMESE